MHSKLAYGGRGQERRSSVWLWSGRKSDEEGARLRTGLSWHGFIASTRHVRPDRLGAADALLGVAAEEGALVVMGAYGHSRLRQWIFGGFTQHVLRGAPVPVLMMH